MFQALILFFLGVSGSVLALYSLCTFLSQVSRGRSEKACQCRLYYEWLMRNGTEVEKKEAEGLMRHGKLEELKKRVGSGLLVKP
jgi:hypothetical protein